MNKENTFLAYPSEAEEKCKFYVYMDENNRLYYLNKEYEKKLEDKNQEINRLNNIINYIWQVFENGSFEDGCDCIKIYDYLKELKENKK